VPTPDQPKEVYAKQLHSNTVFSIRSEAIEKLLALAPEWRDKHLLPSFSSSEVNAFKINIKNKLLAFQNENNQWMLNGATRFQVDADKINGVLKSIQELKASQFVRDSQGDLKSFGLEKPTAQITIERKVGEEITKIDLLLGKTDKNLIYAMNSIEPFIFTIPIGFNAEWPKELWQWRSLHVLNTPAKEFQKIKISNRNGLQSNLLLDEKGNWSPENSLSKLDPQKLASLLLKLGDLKGVRWVGITPSPAYELNQPYLKVEMISNNGAKTLKVGNILPSGGRVAQLENVEGYFEMTLPDFELLTQDLAATEAPSSSSTTEPAPTKQP